MFSKDKEILKKKKEKAFSSDERRKGKEEGRREDFAKQRPDSEGG